MNTCDHMTDGLVNIMCADGRLLYEFGALKEQVYTIHINDSCILEGKVYT